MAVPTVTGLNPASGPAGSPILISGTNFTNDTIAVKFGSTSCGTRFMVVSENGIYAYPPPGSGTVHVTVQTPGGTSPTSSADQFTYDTYVGPPGGGGGSAPTVTGIDPNTSADEEGQGGDTVTITGTGFSTAKAVFFGSVQAPFVIDSDTQITATSPIGDGTVDVTVQNAYGTSATSGADQFTYPDAAVPTITSVSPTTAWYGSTVALLGTGFSTTMSVTVGGVQAEFSITDDTHLLVVIPAGVVGLVDIVVTNVGGSSSTGASDQVTVLSSLPDVPTGLWVQALVNSVMVNWDAQFLDRPVRYRVWRGDDSSTTESVLITSQSNVIIDQLASDGAKYFAVSAIGVDGSETSKCTAVGPVTALEGIDTLTDRSITQAKLALTIRPPILASSAPTLPATEYPAGSTYFNTTDLHLYKTTDGSTWSKLVDAGDIVADSITAGQIAAGAIGADELAVNSIYAKHLTLTDFENLFANGNSELDPTGKDTSATSADVEFRCVVTGDNPYSGTRCRKLDGAGEATPNYVEFPLIPCSLGDTFRVSSKGCCTSAASAGAGVTLELVTWDSSGAWVGEYAMATPNNTTTYGDLHCELTIANTNSAFVSMRLINYAAVGNYTYWDNILFRRKIDANLLVDGSITAAMLTIDGSTSFGSGYDPSTKETPTGAQSKADAAQSAAEATAAADATTKADAAQSNAEGYTDTLQASLGNMAYEDLVAAAKLDSTIISGGYIISSLLTASNIVTGSMSAARITSGTMSCDRLSGGTISGQTIVGGTFKTGTGATRVQIDSTNYDRIQFYASGSSTPAVIYGGYVSGYSQAQVLIMGCGVSLQAPGSSNSINVTQSGVNFGGVVGSFAVASYSQISGGGYSPSQYGSNTDANGIFCQDNYTVSKRWKIYFNNSNNRFGVIDSATGTTHWKTFDNS